MDDEVQFRSCIWVKFECPCRSAIMSEVSLPPNKSFAHSVSVGSYIWGHLESDVFSYKWLNDINPLVPGQNGVDSFLSIPSTKYN